MASIPDPLTRRELLHLKQKRPVEYAAVAAAYQAKGRWSEALDFAERAPDQGERKRLLEEIRTAAIKLGDAFLLARINTLLPLERDHWARAAEAARAQGKPRYALRIAKVMDDQAEVARLELELGLRVPEPPAAAPTDALPGEVPADGAAAPAAEAAPEA